MSARANPGATPSSGGGSLAVAGGVALASLATAAAVYYSADPRGAKRSVRSVGRFFGVDGLVPWSSDDEDDNERVEFSNDPRRQNNSPTRRKRPHRTSPGGRRSRSEGSSQQTQNQKPEQQTQTRTQGGGEEDGNDPQNPNSSESSKIYVPDNANQDCVGVDSEQAGKADGCQGCPNQGACASGEARQKDPAVAVVAEKLKDVKHKILVLSGKGGVGKSTVSCQLAFAFAAAKAASRRINSGGRSTSEDLQGDRDRSSASSSSSSSVQRPSFLLERDERKSGSNAFTAKDFKIDPTMVNPKANKNYVELVGRVAEDEGLTPDEQADVDGLNNAVGLLDIDICGPSLPTMLGLKGHEVHQSASGWSPVYLNANLAVMSIGFMLPNDDDPVIWRGPRKNGLIKQFLTDIVWGDLDYLFVDTPPGTSDEHLAIVGYLEEAKISGAIIVTTPQEVALADVRKEVNFCKKVGVEVIGVVENMQGFLGVTSDGVQTMCAEYDLEYLGAIPLDREVGLAGERGSRIHSENLTSLFTDLVSKIDARVEAIEAKVMGVVM